MESVRSVQKLFVVTRGVAENILPEALWHPWLLKPFLPWLLLLQTSEILFVSTSLHSIVHATQPFYKTSIFSKKWFSPQAWFSQILGHISFSILHLLLAQHPSFKLLLLLLNSDGEPRIKIQKNPRVYKLSVLSNTNGYKQNTVESKCATISTNLTDEIMTQLSIRSLNVMISSVSVVLIVAHFWLTSILLITVSIGQNG